MNWLLDPAPASKFFSNAESILVASPGLKTLELFQASTATYHSVYDIKWLLVSLKCLLVSYLTGGQCPLWVTIGRDALEFRCPLCPESGRKSNEIGDAQSVDALFAKGDAGGQ
jgi:hypothetical protein